MTDNPLDTPTVIALPAFIPKPPASWHPPSDDVREPFEAPKPPDHESIHCAAMAQQAVRERRWADAVRWLSDGRAAILATLKAEREKAEAEALK